MKLVLLDFVLGIFIVVIPAAVATIIDKLAPGSIDPVTVFVIGVGACAALAELILKKAKK